jgi:hypothetical protein
MAYLGVEGTLEEGRASEESGKSENASHGARLKKYEAWVDCVWREREWPPIR